MGTVRLGMMAALAVLMFGSVSLASAQDVESGVRYDSAEVRLRAPAAGALERYRGDPAYDYATGAPRAPSWWERMWRVIREKLEAPFQGEQGWRIATWGLLLLVAGVLVVALLRLLQMDVGGAFRGRTARAAARGDDELEAMPTSGVREALERAEAEGAYRLAVRLHYLLLLREMDQSGLIDARPEKTNRHYVDEVREAPLYDDFRDLTTLFDYVWYGELDLDAARYEALRERFGGLHERLRGERVAVGSSSGS